MGFDYGDPLSPHEPSTKTVVIVQPPFSDKVTAALWKTPQLLHLSKNCPRVSHLQHSDFQLALELVRSQEFLENKV